MLARLSSLLTASLVASAIVLSPVIAASSSAKVPKDSCEYLRKTDKITGKMKPLKTNTNVYWLTPDKAACGSPDYRMDSNVACLNKGWLRDSGLGLENSCFRWLELTNPANNLTAHAQVVDECGGSEDDPFTCNSVYVGVQVFKQLASKDPKEQEQAVIEGRIPNDISWRMMNKVPCWACEGGNPPGNEADGTHDNCLGRDEAGFERCGRKTGNQRVIGPRVAEYCNSHYTCPI